MHYFSHAIFQVTHTSMQKHMLCVTCTSIYVTRNHYPNTSTHQHANINTLTSTHQHHYTHTPLNQYTTKPTSTIPQHTNINNTPTHSPTHQHTNINTPTHQHQHTNTPTHQYAPSTDKRGKTNTCSLSPRSSHMRCSPTGCATHYHDCPPALLPWW